MSDVRAPSLLQRAYSVVNAGLWLLFFLGAAWYVSILPGMSQAAVVAQQRHVQDMRDENSALCEKWGMRAGTTQYSICLQDLADMRARDEKQTLEDISGLL